MSLIKCNECGKEIKEKESRKNENYCKECYKKTEGYSRKKKKNNKLLLMLILVIIVFTTITVTNKDKNNKSNYKINVEKIAVATLNDDDIFYDDLRDNYKGFRLLFVSAEIKNNSQTNYDNLSYKLTTSNTNEYNSASSYITKDEEFIENYYKINNKIFNDSTNDLLGGKNKRIIVGFMVPENELINDTKFKLVISSFDINEAEVEKLEFTSNEIIKSYTMKELYKEDEIEKAEQTISLAYFSSIYDWQGWMIKLEQSYNYKYDNLFDVAFSAITVFTDSANYYYSWNGRKIENEKGSKINFEKIKEFYPSLSQEINITIRALEGIKTLNTTYNKTISSLDKSTLQQVDSDIVNSIIKIKGFFELRYLYV